jgi:hypothetical protein
MIYLTHCSPGKNINYSDHDIPDTLLTWQKSNLFWPWYTWHPVPGEQGVRYIMVRISYFFARWTVCQVYHGQNKLLFCQVSRVSGISWPGKKVTYSDHDIPDTLLTWQKAYLFSPWYTWHTAHLAKKLLILTMIYLTPCSPGKKLTYSHHDIPDTLLTWQKSNLFWPWYTPFLPGEQGVRYIMVRIS